MSEAVQPTKAAHPWLVPLLAVVVVGAIIAGFGLALNRSQQDSIDSGPAPDFTLRLDSGGDFKLSEKRGKVVVMNFWASWCGPCRSEAPMLNSLYTEYRAKGVEFVGVGYLDNRNDALRFISETNMSYPTGNDDGTRVSRAYRVRQVPESYLIDKQGNIAMHISGEITPANVAQVRAALEKALAG